jgi:hypothetical protein
MIRVPRSGFGGLDWKYRPRKDKVTSLASHSGDGKELE